MALNSPFLRGANIYLRGLGRADLEGPYFHWLNDREVTRWMLTGMFPNTEQAMVRFWEGQTQSPSDLLFAICLADGDRHVGNIGLHRIHWVCRSAEIGILLGEREVWGKGVGSEALRLVIEYAFVRLNLNRLYAGAVAKNVGSTRLFEKAGFSREGLMREAYFVDGAYEDCVTLSLLRREWTAPR